MQTTSFIKTIPVQDLDSKVHIFNIEVFKSNENNIRGYIAKTLTGKEIATKFFMDYKTAIEVTAAFRKLIRDNRINLNRL
jgi:hypothetical protein